MREEQDSEVAALVGRARQGDQAAWSALVERHTGLLWSVARSFRFNDAVVADVVQTSWLRLVEHLDDLADPGAVGAWLATTVRRECLRLLRNARREVVAADDQLDQVDADAPPVDAYLLERERDALLWTAVDRLPPRCQRLLRVLMASPPPSYVEVAAALDMPVGSIGPTRGRCLEDLRRRLAESVSSVAHRDSAERGGRP